MTVVAIFPNPISWGWNKLGGWVSGVAADATAAFFGALVGWILDAAVWTVTNTYTLASQTTDVDVRAQWFRGNIFAATASIAAVVYGIAFLAGVTSAALRGQPGELLGSLLVQTPKILVLFVVLIEGTYIVMAATDEIAVWFTSATVGSDAASVFSGFGQLNDIASNGGALTSFVVLVIAGLLFLAGLLVWIVLLLRGAAIYLLVALAPFAAVAMVTRYRGAVRRLFEYLFMVIAAKAIIVMVLVLGASAMLNTPGVGDDIFAADSISVLAPAPAEPGTPVPEAIDPDSLASTEEQAAVTRVVGQLLVGAVVIILALFSPWVVFSLLPGAEAAGGLAQQARGGLLSDVGAAPGVAGVRRVRQQRRATRAVAGGVRR